MNFIADNYGMFGIMIACGIPFFFIALISSVVSMGWPGTGNTIGYYAARVWIILTLCGGIPLLIRPLWSIILFLIS